MKLDGICTASGVDFFSHEEIEKSLEALPDNFLDSDRVGIEVSCEKGAIIIQPLKSYIGTIHFPKGEIKMKSDGVWFSHSGNKYCVRPYSKD